MSVSNILKKLGVSDKFAKSVEASSKAKSISTALVVMRHKAGLTQADVAIKMNVSQSKIAKIERCLNSDLRVGDIEAYVWAVGGSLNIVTRGKEGSFVEIEHDTDCDSNFLPMPTYDKELWRVDKTIVYNAISALASALTYMPHIQTEVPFQIALNQDVARMELVLSELRKVSFSVDTSKPPG